MRRDLFKISFTFTLILFSLNILSCSDVTNISKEQIKEYSNKIDGSGTIDGYKDPLYVINNKILPNKLIVRIKPKYIDSISVLKGDTAIRFYGKDGENGVIIFYANKEIFNDLEPD